MRNIRLLLPESMFCLWGTQKCLNFTRLPSFGTLSLISGACLLCEAYLNSSTLVLGCSSTASPPDMSFTETYARAHTRIHTNTHKHSVTQTDTNTVILSFPSHFLQPSPSPHSQTPRGMSRRGSRASPLLLLGIISTLSARLGSA